MTTEAEYFMMKGLLSELPEKMRNKVEDQAKRITDIVTEDIESGCIAIGVVGMTLERTIEGK